jgi:AraC-like DNA-binding protein
MRLVLDTASVPDVERAAYWSDTLSRTLVPMTAVPHGPRPFSGTITSAWCGYLQVVTVEGDPQTMSRAPYHLAAGEGREIIAVGVLAAGRASLGQDDRVADLAPADLVVYDTTRSYILDIPERARLHVLHLPRRVLAVPDRDLRQITATAIRPHDGLPAILSPFLCALATTAGSHAPEVGERLGGHVGDLLTTLIANQASPAAAEEDDQAARAFVRRIRHYVNQHLADPDLTPESIAAAHRISLRYLYKLWALEGTTIGRWIQQRRLEECRRELGRLGQSGPAISVVAQRWGFVNAAHFSRSFRTVYGQSPSDWRNQSRIGA